ncbi:hypothetical protein, partial [Maribellus luteus]|uniref:hypothetical protein n=1 Tax=Maribellus luteus TaxID=2305463 RepID=UPI0019D444B9
MKQTLCINFSQSKQEKTDIPNFSELISKSFDLRIEEFYTLLDIRHRIVPVVFVLDREKAFESLAV